MKYSQGFLVREQLTSGARVPKQERSRDTQERIITAALAVFAECGFEGASVRSIAERAGVGQPLVVYHFPSKEDLWVATTERTLGKFLERLRPNLEALEGLDPATRLNLIFQDLVHFSAETPELLLLFIDANRRGGPNLKRLVEDQLRPTYELLRELLEAAQSAGVMTAGDPGLIYYAMICVATMPFSVRREIQMVTGRDLSNPDTVQAQANLLARLFFPGLQDAGGPDVTPHET